MTPKIYCHGCDQTFDLDECDISLECAGKPEVVMRCPFGCILWSGFIEDLIGENATVIVEAEVRGG